jgi:hypothetical protein
VALLRRPGDACSTSAVSTAKKAACSCELAPAAAAARALSATKRSTACTTDAASGAGWLARCLCQDRHE